MAETKLKIQSYGTQFNAPQGYMLNGKLSVTVASNNLTVAIKTLAGNDPSAADPMIVRIGDTVRSITAALSVTKNAGTNWCNSGGSGLATNEIDYFTYLGYNTTDGVVIGFSRIPHVKRYDNFSTTSTNEKYCAISTITTAAAGDNYENIGRFAATLSAGAGYTWTVPTFTAENLIQTPIFETRRLSVTPVFAGFSANPTAGETYVIYKVRNNQCDIDYHSASNGTSNSATFTFLLPFMLLDTGYGKASYFARVIDNSASLGGMVQLAGSSSTANVYKDFVGNGFTTSGGKNISATYFTYWI